MAIWLRALVVGLTLLPSLAMSTTSLLTSWSKFDNTFVRLEEDGNLSCLSYDGINCDWSNPAIVPQNKTLKPLACGIAHKTQWDNTGYEVAGHWCNKAYAKLFANWESNGYILVSQNPYGDTMCFSSDGRNCTPTTTVPSNINVNPLICGKIHNGYWGEDGYSNEQHWCNRALKKFTLAVTSDPQYPWINEGGISSSGNEQNDSKESIPILYKSINAYNETKKISGVVINGDITAYGHTWQWEYMLNDALNSLKPQIMLSLGNHDIENNLDKCANNECIRNSFNALEKYVKNYASSYDRRISYYYDGIDGAVKEYYGSFAWSRDIGNTHFVFLNNEPTYSLTASGWNFNDARKEKFNIKSAIPWLDKNLQSARASGKAIILVYHKPSEFKESDGFTSAMLEEMIKKYSVSAIFWGHIHTMGGKVSSFGGAPAIYSGSASTRTYLLTEFDMQNKKGVAYLVKNGNTSQKYAVTSFDLKTPIENLPLSPKPINITFRNSGGYNARAAVFLNGEVTTSSTSPELASGQGWTYTVPADKASSVRLWGLVYTGLVWEPLRLIFNTPITSDRCINVYGTSLNAQWGDC